MRSAKNLPTRTVTVSVPYGPNGETLVTFYNRIKRAWSRSARLVSPGSLDAIGMTDFTFSYFVGNAGPFQLGPIRHGECAISTDTYPILQPDGSPTLVQVQENPPPPGVFVIDITYQGSGTPVAINVCGRSIIYQLGQGVNVTTFTNRKGDPPIECANV